MNRARLRAVSAALTFTATALADVTLRQTVQLQSASFIPPEIRTQAEQQFQSMMPKEIVLRVKGDKAYTSMGPKVGSPTTVAPKSRC